jgi:hypothetical protein
MCRDLARYKHRANVEFLGYVDELADFYDAVEVVVVPMATSSGQKIRTGEALGFGKAVVAHSHAFEGYTPTHAYHQLGSFSDVARACIEVAFDERAREELRVATQKAHQRQSETYEAAIDRTVKAIAGLAPDALFLVDTDRYEREPLFRLNLASALEFASTLYRVAIHFSSGRLPHDPAQLDELGKHGVLLYSPGKAEVTTGYPRGIQVDASALSEMSCECTWVYRELGELDSRCVAGASYSITPNWLSTTALAPYVSMAAGGYTVAQQQPVNGARPSVVSTTVGAPYFTTAATQKFSSPNLLSGPYAIYVLAAPGIEPQATRIAEVLARHASGMPVLVVFATQRAPDQRSRQQAGSSVALRVHSIADVVEGRANYKPYLVIDLTRGAKLTDLLLSYLREKGYPVVSDKAAV